MILFSGVVKAIIDVDVEWYFIAWPGVQVLDELFVFAEFFSLEKFNVLLLSRVIHDKMKNKKVRCDASL